MVAAIEDERTQTSSRCRVFHFQESSHRNFTRLSPGAMIAMPVGRNQPPTPSPTVRALFEFGRGPFGRNGFGLSALFGRCRGGAWGCGGAFGPLPRGFTGRLVIVVLLAWKRGVVSRVRGWAVRNKSSLLPVMLLSFSISYFPPPEYGA